MMRSDETDFALFSFTPTEHRHLTEAERDVALAITRGLSNAEIAALRHRSPRTVANQVAAILRKLDVSSRGELAARFVSSDFL